MLAPPFPADEEDRIAALRALAILDTPPEARFDRLTHLARHIGQVPTALVSLIDTDRQWFKSAQGLDATETPRSISFCGHAILRDDAFIVTDASCDPRFADNPLVTGAPHIRFYAGFPLRMNNGQRVGTLCVLGPEPKQLSDEQIDCLRELSRCVMAELQQRDVTDAARLLYEQGERLRLILDSADVAIMSVDTGGTLQSFNRAAESMFGYREAELVGKSTPRLLHVVDELTADAQALSAERGREFRPGAETLAERALNGAYKREWTFVRRDGTRFPGEFIVTRKLNQDGSLRGLLGMITDITERKRAEHMKNEFVSTVSHELRTPLTSIRGALGLVIGRFNEGISPKARLLLDNANRNAERLSLLLNDILDFEKLSAGHMAFEMVPGDLVQMTKQALAANSGYAAQHHVHLVTGLMPDAAPVHADAHRIQQVFANLISNAVKYSPAQGEVVVSVTDTGKHWRVGVRDRGPGIPESFRAHVFERFAQADFSDAREKGGTGLGLAISHAIIERHEGRMHFVTESHISAGTDTGTEFYFEIPKADRTQPGTEEGQTT